MSAGKKVLFVDDDRDFLKSQSILFASKGFQVITAESGEEALKVLENEVPDIIFLDLMMEHYDSGFTLSYQIRKDERFKNVPLVMLSGVASQTGRRFDKQTDELKKWSKLDGFVDKPVSGKQLLKIVEEKLGLVAVDGH